jgi:hypothetical protein
MADLSATIAPKSNQLNSDDLIGRTLTITITKVTAATAEQPIAINFEGDGGKPYYPCKGMRRVMVMVWGPDGSQYAGRSMTLYRDPKVKFGGIEVGGIRISHMSHIEGDQALAIAETKGAKKVFQVKVLRQQAPAAANTAQTAKPVPFMDRVATMLAACKTLAEVDEAEARPVIQEALIKAPKETVHQLNGMFAARRKNLEPAETIDPETGEIGSDWSGADELAGAA